MLLYIAVCLIQNVGDWTASLRINLLADKKARDALLAERDALQRQLANTMEESKQQTEALRSVYQQHHADRHYCNVSTIVFA